MQEQQQFNDGAANGISTGADFEETAAVGASDDGAGTVGAASVEAAIVDDVGVAGAKASAIDCADAGASSHVGAATGSDISEDDGVT
jgi:hypothetical protein